jgi:hypothetical protein
MRKSLLLLAAVLMGWSLNAQDCGPYAFRSFNIADSTQMKGSGVDTFSLSQAYPAALPAKPALAWEKTDFRAGSGGFMKQVLDYCWEGMDSAKWVAQNNTVRKWYHAPWLDQGYAGREFVHGLRMDHTSFPGDLHPNQRNKERNYSITYYNELAGYTIGQVWCNPAKPDPTKAKFPVGSVWFKLVFTTADTSGAPYLLNAWEWEAFVEKGADQPISPKRLQKLRLLEVDFGVRVASPEAVNGWVYGVYVFSGQKQGQGVKEKLVPIGLQWGNDPGLTPQVVRAGEKPIAESWINTNVWNENEPGSSLVQKLGWGYRLQGPVGSHNTSIMSQHMTAGWPPAPAFAPSGTPVDSMLKWHRNLPSGTPFAAGQASLDYCLELMEGMRNQAIAGGDSVLAASYKEELAEMLGFEPIAKGEVSEEEIAMGEVKEGLQSSRNLFVFIGFLTLVLVLIGLLIWNFLKK